ncbi:MAG: alpha/beta hydrolase [Planctomycetes bacterium]|nr:alpha/beta hydrolase [Planctomycetota bacterium]
MFVWLLVPAGLYLAVCVAAWAFERKLVYFPGPAPTTTPREFGLEYVDAPLTTSDGVALSAWFLPARAPRVAVLVCHGNAGSIENRIDKARVFVELGASVLLFDYRGYGASAGSPSEEGTYLDAECAFDELARCAPGLAVVAYGESLGGAIAVELARRRPLAGLILDSTFTSLPAVGANAYPWLPVRLLARTRYDSEAKLATLDVPVLVAHSRGDRVVPFEHGRALHAAAKRPVAFVETRGGHNEGGLLLAADSARAVADFLAAVAPARR